MIVLSVLTRGPLHGYSIARRIEQLTDDVLRVEEGSLYPALYRMEARRLVKAEWGLSDTGRRIRLYRLTGAGRKHLGSETDNWQLISRAMAQLLAAGATGASS